MKKFVSVLLSLAMLMSMLVVPVAAEEEAAGAGAAAPVHDAYDLYSIGQDAAPSGGSNLSLLTDVVYVTQEDCFKVVVHMRANQVSSFTGHLEFDADQLKCIGVSADEAYYAMAESALAAQLSTGDEANRSGKVGWGFARAAETGCNGGDLVTVEFRAIGGGRTYIGLYEDSAGTDGFKGGSGAAAIVEIETRHVHELTKTEAVPPTATEPGNTAYWTCSGCGKYFGDAAASTEIEENSWVLQPLGDMPVFTATPFPAVYNEEDEEYVIDKSGKPIHTGDIVAYQIAVSNNPGMIGFKIFLDYDKTQLELKDMTAARKFSGGVWLPVKDIANMGVISWVTTGDIAANGTVVTLFFTVTAESGTTVEFPMRVASCMNEAKVELGAQVIGNATAVGHVFSAAWSMDADNHWHVCEGCDAVSEQATHYWAYRDRGDGTHECFCEVCGYVEPPMPHYGEGGWQANNDSHWMVCDICGAAYDAAAHTVDYTDNGNGTHSLVCTVCGQVESTGAHTDTGSWAHTDAAHWKECGDCGAKFDKAVHSFIYQANTDGTHSLMCKVCGYEKETANHSSDTWHTDEQGHWKLCDACGAEFARSVHASTGKHVATCVSAAVCDVCDVSYGERDVENHDFVYGTVIPATSAADGEIQKECSRCHATASEALTFHENGFNMSIGEAVVHSGTVTVPVSVANNPGINGLKVTVQYDKTKLRLVGASLDEGVPGLLNRTEDNVTWVSGSDSSRNGTMFLLEFEVLDSTEASDVSITVCYKYDDVLNAAKERLQFGVMPGEVHITAPGDIDGDGVVDLSDVSRLLQYYSAIGTSVEVSIVPGSQDVDGDGSLLLADVSTLLRYYSALGTSAEGTVKIY